MDPPIKPYESPSKMPSTTFPLKPTVLTETIFKKVKLEIPMKHVEKDFVLALWNTKWDMRNRRIETCPNTGHRWLPACQPFHVKLS